MPGQDLEEEARLFVALIQGRHNGARRDAALLNAGLIYYIADQVDTMPMSAGHAGPYFLRRLARESSPKRRGEAIASG